MDIQTVLEYRLTKRILGLLKEEKTGQTEPKEYTDIEAQVRNTRLGTSSKCGSCSHRRRKTGPSGQKKDFSKKDEGMMGEKEHEIMTHDPIGFIKLII